MSDTMMKVSHISKQYRLGQIGGTTLRDELQRWGAKWHHKEDPTKKIGAREYANNEVFLALDDVSFDVEKGERVGIIGHNGAGKSTLLKLISRITAPTKGDIWLNGRVASMLEVGTGFHGELTGRENIYMNGAILGMKKREIDEKMEDIIDFSECRQFINTPVKRYSSGMYVKLAFAVAAHLDAEIMIMDEVLAVGDMAFQKKCLDKMNEVSREEGRTILYVSHNMNTIRQLCNRCIVLNQGKVVFDGKEEDGINTYLGLGGISDREIDLSSAQRNKEYLNGIKLTSVKNLNDSGWSIRTGEKLRFEIRAEASQSFDVMSFRSRLTNIDGHSISVFVAPDLFSCKANETITIPLEADTSQLVPGRYCLTPALYQYDRLGTTLFYDHINRIITFEVRDDGSFNQGIPWVQKYWGDIRLPELVDLRK